MTCKRGHETDIKKMILKLGGLLCPKCRTIIFQPYVDEEYFEEVRRRQNEDDNKSKQEGA